LWRDFVVTGSESDDPIYALMGDDEEKRGNDVYLADKRGDEPCYGAETTKGYAGIDAYT